MPGTRWLVSAASELPSGEDWLSARERRVLDGLAYEKRRGDWLLGRWTAKRALAARLAAPLDRFEVIAAEDGAPEPLLDGAPAPAALSISHRGGRALATVARAGTALGCDLELIEPRSPAFLREWLAQAEREAVERAGPAGGVLLANLLWCAKEAAAKARRGGLRLNVRRAVVSLGEERDGDDDWRALRVRWEEDGETASGWWREEPGWVMAVVTEPAGDPPRRL
jgi:4'-phosphopantetheinyl transferase